jgi:hypothetical protein
LEYFISSIYITLFLILIFKWKIFCISGLSRKEIALAFIIKTLAALLLIWFYTVYYRDRHNADIFKYFDDSIIISSSFFSNPKDFFSMVFGFDNNYEYLHQNYFINMNHWDSSYSSSILNESRLVIRLNAIIGLVSFKIHFIHALFFSFLSLIGFVFLIKTLKKTYPKENFRNVFWVIITFPSVLLFSSGILKEPLIILGLGICVHCVMTLSENNKIKTKTILYLILSLVVILKVKFYVFCCLITGLIVYVSIKKINKHPNLTLLINVFLISIFVGFLHFSGSQYDPIAIISEKQQDFIRLAEFYNAGSIIDLSPIKNNFLSFLKAIPKGFTNSILKPLPWEISSKIHLISVFENLIILGLITYVLSKYKKLKKTITKNNYASTYAVIVFVVSLYCIIGITTPVFGALIRYKIPGLIFILIGATISIEKIQNSKS